MKRRDILKTIGASASVALAGCTINVPEDWGQVQVVEEENTDTSTQTTTEIQTQTETSTETQTSTSTETSTATETEINTPTSTPSELEQNPLIVRCTKCGYATNIPDNDPCPQVVGASRTYVVEPVIVNTDEEHVVSGTLYVDFRFDSGTARTGRPIELQPGEQTEILITEEITCGWNPDTVEIESEDVFIEDQEIHE